MAYYSPVAPVEVLIQMKERGFLDPYILLLAHDVVANPAAYKQLLHDFEGTIILDNSLIELGKPVDVDTMLLASALVNPTYVVLPDMLLDAAATIEMSLDAVRSWVPKLLPDVGIMIAAQGKTVDEATDCVKRIMNTIRGEQRDVFAKKEQRPILVGIPRAYTNEFGTRAVLVQSITALGLECHLLGMSEHMWDDLACCRMKGVTGIDSASPLRAGFENRRFDGKTDDLRPRPEFFEKCKGLSLDMAFNIGFINGVIKSAR